jgi:hypothetical protein
MFVHADLGCPISMAMVTVERRTYQLRLPQPAFHRSTQLDWDGRLEVNHISALDDSG